MIFLLQSSSWKVPATKTYTVSKASVVFFDFSLFLFFFSLTNLKFTEKKWKSIWKNKMFKQCRYFMQKLLKNLMEMKKGKNFVHKIIISVLCNNRKTHFRVSSASSFICCMSKKLIHLVVILLFSRLLAAGAVTYITIT